MAVKQQQGLILEAGEPFRVNGTVFVLTDDGEIVTLEQYQHTKDRPRPLCAICDTNKARHICSECSGRLFGATKA